jgi:copper chaperone
MFLPRESPALRWHDVRVLTFPPLQPSRSSATPPVTGENTVRFHVENMTCGDCDRTIRKAIAALSPQARVTIDLRAKTVEIDGALTPAQIVTALADEGYTAVRISDVA